MCEQKNRKKATRVLLPIIVLSVWKLEIVSGALSLTTFNEWTGGRAVSFLELFFEVFCYQDALDIDEAKVACVLNVRGKAGGKLLCSQSGQFRVSTQFGQRRHWSGLDFRSAMWRIADGGALERPDACCLHRRTHTLNHQLR
ncbi:hypothetical protein [Paraburkholderia youngii]|uniref:hypothetical protein n=1 Tax=Paraburkholderia youngii TaxID=2782701 RepID=UPI00158FCE62|nr:hypothetical protein [Paraburkholderia youngii]NUX55374.1 hypothetical protein [Paraburkholderia youngii]